MCETTLAEPDRMGAVGEKKAGVMDGIQGFDVSTWGIVVPGTKTGKSQDEEQEKEMNSVLNMLCLRYL